MRFIGYNIIPILLVLLSGYMIYADKSNWGWLIGAALIFAVFPSSENNNQNGKRN